MHYDYDLIVIGAGSGGVRTARMSSSKGLKVAIIESRELGGTCVNVGCIPKKLFVYASEYGQKFEESKGFGWNIENSKFEWQTGNNFIVSSDEAFFLKSLPKKILIVGGGYIAIEFAGIFNGLGVETHLMYRGPLFLKGFDIDIRKKIKEEYIKHGVKIHFSKEVNSIKQNPPVDSSDKSNKFKYEISTKTGDSIQSDLVMFATGRKPNLDTLGLDKLKIEKNQDGTLIVDEFYRTSVKSIFAIGDVVGKKQLTPVAIAEGNVLTKYLTEGKKPFVNYKNIPTAIFSTPNSASVGYTEDEAIIEFNKDLQIYKSQFKPMKQTLGGSQTKIFMKLIVVKSTNKVVGCHMVGDYAGEIIQGLAIAIQAGATKKDFDNTIGIHPTAAEEFVTLK